MPSDCNVLNGKCILVVDDEVDCRTTIASMLEATGAEVVEAESADEALAALGALRFDLIISDLAMPECDGYSLMKQVRRIAATASVPAVAVSGLHNAERSLQAGFNLHLCKPVSSRHLREQLRALVTPRHADR